MSVSLSKIYMSKIFTTMNPLIEHIVSERLYGASCIYAQQSIDDGRYSFWARTQEELANIILADYTNNRIFIRHEQVGIPSLLECERKYKFFLDLEVETQWTEKMRNDLIYAAISASVETIIEVIKKSDADELQRAKLHAEFLSATPQMFYLWGNNNPNKLSIHCVFDYFLHDCKTNLAWNSSTLKWMLMNVRDSHQVRLFCEKYECDNPVDTHFFDECSKTIRVPFSHKWVNNTACFQMLPLTYELSESLWMSNRFADSSNMFVATSHWEKNSKEIRLRVIKGGLKSLCLTAKCMPNIKQIATVVSKETKKLIETTKNMFPKYISNLASWTAVLMNCDAQRSTEYRTWWAAARAIRSMYERENDETIRGKWFELYDKFSARSIMKYDKNKIMDAWNGHHIMVCYSGFHTILGWLIEDNSGWKDIMKPYKKSSGKFHQLVAMARAPEKYTNGEYVCLDDDSITWSKVCKKWRHEVVDEDNINELVADVLMTSIYIEGREPILFTKEAKYIENRANKYTDKYMTMIRGAVDQFTLGGSIEYMGGRILLSHVAVYVGNQFNPKSSIIFRPSGLGLDQEVCNTFYGYFGRVRKTDVDISPIINHIKHVICGGESESENDCVYSYVIWWLHAILIKRQMTQKAIVLYSPEQGTGKTLFAEYIAAIVGNNHAKKLTSHELTEKHNINLDKLIFGYADEQKINRDQLENVKDYITSDKLNINPKGVNQYQVENHSNFMLSTNDVTHIEIDGNDRRFLVLRVSASKKNDIDYFRRVIECHTREHYDQFMWWLANEAEINDEFAYREPPMTSSKRNVATVHEDPILIWFREFYRVQSEMAMNEKRDNVLIKRSAMVKLYVEWYREDYKNNKNAVPCNSLVFHSTFKRLTENVFVIKEVKIKGYDYYKWAVRTQQGE